MVNLHRKLLAGYMEQCHTLGLELLKILSRMVDSCRKSDLVKNHRPGEMSTSSLGLLRYVVPKPESENFGHVPHTDAGTLTFLYATEQGLQIKDSSGSRWLFVKPRARCLVVNVGDSLHMLSQRALKSAIHRVVPHKSVHSHRYSFIYFMRPTEDTLLQLPGGSFVPSVQWQRRKFEIFASSQDQQSQEENRQLLYGYSN